MTPPITIELPEIGTRWIRTWERTTVVSNGYRRYDPFNAQDFYIWHKDGKNFVQTPNGYHLEVFAIANYHREPILAPPPARDNSRDDWEYPTYGNFLPYEVDNQPHLTFGTPLKGILQEQTGPIWIRRHPDSRTLGRFNQHNNAFLFLDRGGSPRDLRWLWHYDQFSEIPWNAPRVLPENEKNHQMPEIAWNAPSENFENLQMPAIDWYVPDFKNLEMPEIMWGARDETLYNLQMPRIEWNAGRPLANGLRDEYLLCGQWPPEILRVSDAVNIGRRDQYWTCGIVWNIPLTDVWEMPGIEWNAPSVLERIERGYYND